VCGIGDDCAILRLPSGHEALLTTDFSLEDVHFRRSWHPAETVGHRCLTRGLSDIAAMGGDPLAAFLSLALPADLPQSWVDGFFRGFLALARRFKVTLAGGDIAQSPGMTASPLTRGRRRALLRRTESTGKILADVMVLGSAPRGSAVLRSGACPGDDIFVTGSLGAASAVLHRLYRAPSQQTDFSTLPRTRLKAGDLKHYYPTPRVAVGRWLRERRLPSAMIDISDGLSSELSHICEESGTGAWVAAPAIPVAPGATFDEALHGGDEYELLFTVPASRHNRIPDRIAGVPIRWLGTITRKTGLWLVSADMKSRQPLERKGWEHFSG